jgi:hypothetical protein
MAMEMAAVLIPEAMFTVIGRTMVSPTAQVEELNEPMVVVIGCARRLVMVSMQIKAKTSFNEVYKYFMFLG